MSNMRRAEAILQMLWRQGVREAVVCAGARNAPLVGVLSRQSHLQVHPFFEERSAGFFAIGRMLATRRPVVVITTSGTAAAELLPAIIESDYQGLPFVALTADRPQRYRGSGAPQTINQVGLYSHYVEKTWDIEENSSENLEWSLSRPIHVNVCFDEPLLDDKCEAWPQSLEQKLRVDAEHTKKEPGTLKMKAPLVIVGGVPLEHRAEVLGCIKAWGRPVYAEGPSNMRGHPELMGYEILGGEKSLAQLQYDGVIRVGSVPTLRLWRDLEKSEIPVVHFAQTPRSGLPREPLVYPLAALSGVRQQFEDWKGEEQDVAIASMRKEFLRVYPLSEPAWVEWLSSQIPHKALVFLGNSLPIREWDFAARGCPAHEIFANRGVNGIDGLISTFMGLADRESSNWCVLGDLSALYDLTGPWPNRFLQVRDLNLVIINNGGGRIFHRMFRNPLFENTHDLNFKAWAEMWGWDYIRLEKETHTLGRARKPRVIEIVPDNAQTEAFANAWENIK